MISSDRIRRIGTAGGIWSQIGLGCILSAPMTTTQAYVMGIAIVVLGLVSMSVTGRILRRRKKEGGV